MSNWLPTVALYTTILFATIAFSNQLQCNELEHPTWRVFRNLSDYRNNNRTFNVVVNAETNWVRIKRLPQTKLGMNEFNTTDAGYIVRMDLSNLGIRTVINGTFNDLYCMGTLDLSENSITTIPPGALAGMVHLKVLNLTKNFVHRLGTDMFGYLKVLHTLDLSTNVIQTVEENAFDNFPKLQFLNLTNNLLVEVDFVQWSLAPTLINLNLTYNRLEFIKFKPNITYQSFTRLDLSYNNLEYLDVPKLKAMAPNMALLFIHGNKFHCAFLERMVEDFARFHFFHNVMNYTNYNVDGIDCIGRFDEDLTLFDKTHGDPQGPADIFPAKDIPHGHDAGPSLKDEFLRTMAANNHKVLEAIHSLRTIIVCLFIFVLIFICGNVLFKSGLVHRALGLRPQNRRPHHDVLDSSVEVEDFRLIQARV